MTDTLDAAALRSWIGRTDVRHDVLALDRVAALGATLDWDDLAPVEGEAAPPGAHWLYFRSHAPGRELGPDGHARRGDFLPPVPLARRMWAGSRLVWQGPLRLGGHAIRRSTIADVASKQGRNGALVFVTVAHEIEQDGVVRLTEEHDIVYRQGELAPGAGAARKAPAEASWSRTVRADPVLLFRYSALTFNGHRIHYDRPWCREEGYPGLVVHGPLLATWLLDLLRRARPEAALRRFRFRALRPAFDGIPITLAGRPTAGGAALWAETEGALAMEAEAELGPGAAASRP
jgi:3-methylfumaryl-CoA hydratase